MKDELIPPCMHEFDFFFRFDFFNDNTYCIAHMQYLYDVCCSPEKAIVFFPNGTHNCTYESNSEKFFHCFIDFVNKAWKSADKPLCNVIV